MFLIQLEAHFEADSPQVDLGVGAFGFFQEILSAIPLIKDRLRISLLHFLPSSSR